MRSLGAVLPSGSADAINVSLAVQNLMCDSGTMDSVPTSPDRDDGRGEVWRQRRLALGKRIRALRQERGLSQESLALESGLSRNMLIQVEWGQRGLLAERLGDIAEVLGVEVGDLFKEAGGGESVICLLRALRRGSQRARGEFYPGGERTGQGLGRSFSMSWTAEMIA